MYKNKSFLALEHAKKKLFGPPRELSCATLLYAMYGFQLSTSCHQICGYSLSVVALKITIATCGI
jgi:hypothetical protein